jgi:hypothetical protein
MTHLDFNRKEKPESSLTQIKNTRDYGCTCRECGRGEYELQPPTKTGLVRQLAQCSKREEDK